MIDSLFNQWRFYKSAVGPPLLGLLSTSLSFLYMNNEE
jgi:hypothetical protein